jgi:hypothetical protein
LCTDGTYIYGNTGTRLYKLTWDGSDYTEDSNKILDLSYSLVYMDSRIWGAGNLATPPYTSALIMQNPNLTLGAVYYTGTDYDPEEVCTDGTYVYTDNMDANGGSVWKFHRSGGSIVNDGSSGVYGNTRGITYDSNRDWVVASGQLTENVKAFDTSLNLTGLSLARDYITNDRGIGVSSGGFIWDTGGGVTSWLYGDSAYNNNPARAQVVWTTP